MLRSLTSLLLWGAAQSGLVPGFRPPCTPLNVVSPYQSVWSCSDRLYDSAPEHWDGSPVTMLGVARVDGSNYRFLGVSPAVPATAQQERLTVAPATTTYDFRAGGVTLRVQFSGVAVDLDGDAVSASRPVTHVSFQAASADGQAHSVQIYYDSTADGAVFRPDEQVRFERPSDLQRALTILRVGTVAQEEMTQGSDRINWGHWYVAAPNAPGSGLHSALGYAAGCRQSFANGSYFQLADGLPPSLAANASWPVLSLAWDLGQVQAEDSKERHMTLAYDQVVSMWFFGTRMPPLWRRRWADPIDMLEATEERRAFDLAAADAFDANIVMEMEERGGPKFATLASLAYRQVVGGTQAVHNPVTGEEWVFMKEISSDGDVSTVDVVYPAFPMFQYLYPEYFRKLLLPLLVYAANETGDYGWKVPYDLAWAPHHLGHWPVCNLVASQQEQMPVEESANMLLMLTGLYEIQRDIRYLDKYWAMVDGWADFIVASLPDPGNQLCTDDFEGPSPHNTNLAAKGILGLVAYSKLVSARGDAGKARGYAAAARRFVQNWTAAADDGDHFRIQFNLPGTWSMKYNMVFQKSLGLDAFPEEVLVKEANFYQGKMLPCGVPMDNRHPYTKTDWSMWASLLGSEAQFQAFVEKLYLFANSTTGRVPLSDWYNAETCGVVSFRARPVQGGLFAPMMAKALEELHI